MVFSPSYCYRVLHPRKSSSITRRNTGPFRFAVSIYAVGGLTSVNDASGSYVKRRTVSMFAIDIDFRCSSDRCALHNAVGKTRSRRASVRGSLDRSGQRNNFFLHSRVTSFYVEIEAPHRSLGYSGDYWCIAATPRTIL